MEQHASVRRHHTNDEIFFDKETSSKKQHNCICCCMKFSDLQNLHALGRRLRLPLFSGRRNPPSHRFAFFVSPPVSVFFSAFFSFLFFPFFFICFPCFPLLLLSCFSSFRFFSLLFASNVPQPPHDCNAFRVAHHGSAGSHYVQATKGNCVPNNLARNKLSTIC